MKSDLEESGVIRHVGMSSHNPKVAVKAAQSGFIEMSLLMECSKRSFITNEKACYYKYIKGATDRWLARYMI